MFIPTDFAWVYLPNFFNLFPYFAAGMLIFAFRDNITLNKQYALISLVLLVVSLFFGGFITIFTIFGSYFIIYLAYSKSFKFYNFAKFGDFSYGLYIFWFVHLCFPNTAICNILYQRYFGFYKYNYYCSLNINSVLLFLASNRKTFYEIKE